MFVLVLLAPVKEVNPLKQGLKRIDDECKLSDVEWLKK